MRPKTQAAGYSAEWNPDAPDDASYKWKAFSAVGLSLVTMVMSFSIIFLALDAIATDFGSRCVKSRWLL